MACEFGPHEFGVAVTAGDIQIGTLNMVVISKREYESLKDDSAWYNALRDAGVDNWGGYDNAIDELREAGYFDE